MSDKPKSKYDIHGVVDKVEIDNLNHFIDVIIHNAGPRRQTGLGKRKKEAHDAAQKDLRNLVQDIGLHQCPREPPSFDDPVPRQNINRQRNHVDVGLMNPVFSQSDEWKKKLGELVDRCCSRPKLREARASGIQGGTGWRWTQLQPSRMSNLMRVACGRRGISTTSLRVKCRIGIQIDGVQRSIETLRQRNQNEIKKSVEYGSS
ncbi:hypothetical protein BKA81DRAFT_155313 [Phyllosticta paracitricarpa]|uniref:Uncharacterized protein n=1 Tax=Phyllosticta citricarpa TaxID=55181 RepID=A0ABR1LQY4_9PEZI